jgi:glycosyltransferase involved in cell wall biosynthesis
VLFYAPSLAEVTGGGRVVVDWAAVAVRSGYRTTIATPDGREPPWTGTQGLSVVPRERAPDRADLVAATIWWTAWHCDRWRRRGVRTVHLLQDDEERWATRPDHRRIVRAAHQLIPTKICVSRWVAESCAPAGDTVHLVPPAVAVPIAGPRGRRSGPIVVGLPYRNLRAKGWRVMDAVATRLRERGPRLRFRVWGPDAPRAVGDRYDDVHEPASDDELLRLYDSCDVVLHTSWHDGFPLPPIEAMARRAAVVATGTGGLAEYARHGHDCLLAEPGDVGSLAEAVERLADDAGLRERLVEGGVATARRYSRERFTAAAARTLALVAD